MKLLLFSWFLISGFTACLSQNNSNSLIQVNGQAITLENLLQQYIRIPSVSGNEKEAGDFIKRVCEENGLIITDFGAENGKYNFAASVLPLEVKKPNLVLLNHVDVVPGHDDEEKDSFSGNIDNGNVFGRGAIDNKGAAVMQLSAVVNANQILQKTELPYNVTFLTVSCEETQCGHGVSYVIANFFDILNPATVIGEGPSELTTLIGGEFKNPIFGISLAHKRSFWINLTLDIQTSGHGSVTPLNYANKDMIQSLQRLVTKKQKIIFNDINTGMLKSLAEHKKGIEKLVLRHPKFFKPLLAGKLRSQPELMSIFTNTTTVTNIASSAGAHNQIAEGIEVDLDCRLLPDTDEDQFLKDVRKILRNENIQVEVFSKTPKTIRSSKDNIYYYNLMQAIKLNYTGTEVIPIMLPNLNDLGAFRSKGVPCYASIPVYFTREQVESIHNKNENISIKALYDGARVYYDFIELMQKLK